MPRLEFGFKHPPLTKEQILEMKSGWRLEQAVAMLVMGWQALTYQDPRGISGEWPASLIPPCKADHAYNVCPTEPYSTDEQYAWKVIDEVGGCCTWLIEISSEGCNVGITGLSVALCHKESLVALQSNRREDFAKLVCQVALLSDARQGSCVTEHSHESVRQAVANNG